MKERKKERKNESWNERIIKRVKWYIELLKEKGEKKES